MLGWGLVSCFNQWVVSGSDRYMVSFLSWTIYRSVPAVQSSFFPSAQWVARFQVSALIPKRLWWAEPSTDHDGWAADWEINLGAFKPLSFGGCLLLQHNVASPDWYSSSRLVPFSLYRYNIKKGYSIKKNSLFNIVPEIYIFREYNIVPENFIPSHK